MRFNAEHATTLRRSSDIAVNAFCNNPSHWTKELAEHALAELRAYLAFVPEAPKKKDGA